MVDKRLTLGFRDLSLELKLESVPDRSSGKGR